jgi:hypothetical protein
MQMLFDLSAAGTQITNGPQFGLGLGVPINGYVGAAGPNYFGTQMAH